MLRQVRKSKGSVVVARRGRAAAVVTSAEAYTRAGQDGELLRLLVCGGKEIAAAKAHSLDAVLVEADTLLAEGNR